MFHSTLNKRLMLESAITGSGIEENAFPTKNSLKRKLFITDSSIGDDITSCRYIIFLDSKKLFSPQNFLAKV